MLANAKISEVQLNPTLLNAAAPYIGPIHYPRPRKALNIPEDMLFTYYY